MISKTTQPTLINKPSNNLPYDAKFTKCSDSKIPFRSKVMPFLISAYCFYSHGNGDFRLATVTHQCYTTSK